MYEHDFSYCICSESRVITVMFSLAMLPVTHNRCFPDKKLKEQSGGEDLRTFLKAALLC